MGYTHYFEATRSFTAEEWDAVCQKAQVIKKHCIDNGIKLQFEYDDAKPVRINKTTIRFNGVDEEGHETFIIYKDREKSKAPWGSYFNFCKTALKPYDLAVTLVLLAAHDVAPGVLSIGSDGDWDSEWVEARTDYKALFGTEPCWVKEEA